MWVFEVSAGPLLNATGAVAIAGLAAWVALVRRRAANAAFGLFGGGFGLGFLARALFDMSPADAPQAVVLLWLHSVLLMAGIAGLVWLALVYPPVRRAHWVTEIGAPLLVALVVLAVPEVLGDRGTSTFLEPFLAVGRAPAMTLAWTTHLFLAVWWAALYRLAIVHGNLRTATDRAGPFALMSAALVIFPAFTAGVFSLGGDGWDAWIGIVTLGANVGLAALWLRNAALTRPSSVSRNVALLALAVSLGAMAVSSLPGLADSWEVAATGLFGVSRLVTVVVLAYAILRYELLGIDMRIKWTLQQGTVAAIFVAVFFIVSESAAQFLSGRTGTYIGIIAAGVLVFAIAPLQNLAHRFADKALPDAKPLGSMSGEERVATYRELARVAWADGRLTRDEREMLHAARERLGLTHEQAAGIESDAMAAAPA